MEIQTTQVTQMPTVSRSNNGNAQGDGQKNLPTAAEIQTWLVSYTAKLLELEPDEVDVTIPFDCYGLDSAVAVGLAGDLETWLDREQEPTLVYDYPTIEALTRHLVESLSDSKSSQYISYC